MFVGRKAELKALNSMYEKDSFQLAVVYGRRRVGKTTLIDEFVRNKPTLFFTAQQKSSVQNLQAFSREVYIAFGLPSDTGAFSSWSSALSFIAQKVIEREDAGEPPLVLVFDEFPYAAETDPALPSIFQIAIDREFRSTRLRIILCGSNEGFMESEVLGRKSPLYGRRTMQLHIRPFDYLDAAAMLPDSSAADYVRYYATFGGTPYYLAQIDRSLSYEDNVRSLLFTTSGLLYEEPLMLLRQEFREPALYNSVLDAVGAGNGTPNRIAAHAGIEPNSAGKYIRQLKELGILEKEMPFGDNPAISRKGRYRLGDPFFAYWYQFVSGNVGAIEAGAGEAVAQRCLEESELSTYIGRQFERICLQWIMRQNAAGSLPFLATEFGRWWGTDPTVREEADIDVIAANKKAKTILLGECKWRNGFDESAALKTLEHRAELIKKYSSKIFVLFSKYEASEGTKGKVQTQGNVMLVCADEMYGER